MYVILRYGADRPENFFERLSYFPCCFLPAVTEYFQNIVVTVLYTIARMAGGHVGKREIEKPPTYLLGEAS